MATKDLLLEIGVEEIPDWMIVDGLTHLSSKLTDLVAQAVAFGPVAAR